MSNTRDLCEFLQWDTEFFGYRIGRFNGQTITEQDVSIIKQWCSENEIECLYLLVKSDDPVSVRVLEDQNFRQMDVRVIYNLNLEKSFELLPAPEGLELGQALANDVDDLLKMVDGAFIHTRFYYDSHFSDQQANDLYRTWVRRSVLDGYADRVIVLRKNNIAQGFIACTLDQTAKTGGISLIGVAETARGQGLAKILVTHAVEYFRQEKMQKADVVTQARNIAANRLYQSCGYRTHEVMYWYHKWF